MTERDEAHDLSEWRKLDEFTYVKSNNEWWSWKVFQRADGLWYWWEIDHDAWDGERVVDELIDASETGFPTWQDAANWVNQGRD